MPTTLESRRMTAEKMAFFLLRQKATEPCQPVLGLGHPTPSPPPNPPPRTVWQRKQEMTKCHSQRGCVRLTPRPSPSWPFLVFTMSDWILIIVWALDIKQTGRHISPGGTSAKILILSPDTSPKSYPAPPAPWRNSQDTMSLLLQEPADPGSVTFGHWVSTLTALCITLELIKIRTSSA